MSDINTAAPSPAPQSAPAPAPAPTPSPAPAPSAPQVRAVNPTIDIQGRQVNPLGQEIAAQDEISFDEISRPPAKAGRPKASDKPSAPTTPDAGDAAKPQPAAPSAPEQPAAPDSPFALAAQAATDNQTKSGARNYAELPTELQAIAKKLPNALYTNLVDTYKKWNDDITAERNKVVEAQKQATESANRFTVETPDAYKIDPQYSEVVSQYGQAATELNHYTDQLAAIDAGEGWKIIAGYDQAGDPVFQDVPAPADGRVDYRAKAHVQRALQQLAAQQTELQNRAGQIQAYYRNAANETQSHYKEAHTRLFKDLDGDKLTDPTEKQVYEYAIKALPRAEQSRYSAKFLGLAAVIVRRGAVREQALLERAERAERMLKNSAAADPVRPAANAAGAATSQEMIDFSSL